ncbi:ATP cone domain-containing protein [Methanoculleus sp. 7T]|uniref:ATP cone domain-containing protein n=1 Tax=Methanoculleus sp. 7T TaxID=2937282 RepID=UPI0020BDFBD5|nr:ATP cone domain-containing protein [Methanoculleus sp. 7T]MCK8519320.1 ATP cone domain-containing protein [Methanoculleus sp. 7T]
MGDACGDLAGRKRDRKHYHPRAVQESHLQEVSKLVDVVKLDGRREPFVREKVTVSAMKAGAPPEEARKIGEAIERVAYDGMPSGEIRQRVLEQLRDRNPEWEQNWLMYDRAVKKRGAAAVAGLPAR